MHLRNIGNINDWDIEIGQRWIRPGEETLDNLERTSVLSVKRHAKHQPGINGRQFDVGRFVADEIPRCPLCQGLRVFISRSEGLPYRRPARIVHEARGRSGT
jgi:hypothetical protein